MTISELHVKCYEFSVSEASKKYIIQKIWQKYTVYKKLKQSEETESLHLHLHRREITSIIPRRCPEGASLSLEFIRLLNHEASIDRKILNNLLS